MKKQRGKSGLSCYQVEFCRCPCWFLIYFPRHILSLTCNWKHRGKHMTNNIEHPQRSLQSPAAPHSDTAQSHIICYQCSEAYNPIIQTHRNYSYFLQSHELSLVNLLHTPLGDSVCSLWHISTRKYYILEAGRLKWSHKRLIYHHSVCWIKNAYHTQWYLFLDRDNQIIMKVDILFTREMFHITSRLRKSREMGDWTGWDCWSHICFLTEWNWVIFVTLLRVFVTQSRSEESYLTPGCHFSCPSVGSKAQTGLCWQLLKKLHLHKYWLRCRQRMNILYACEFIKIKCLGVRCSCTRDKDSSEQSKRKIPN